MGLKPWQAVSAVRISLACATVAISIYFLWFIIYELKPFFAQQGALGEEGTKIEVCVAGLLMSVLSSVYRYLASLRPANNNADRDRSPCRSFTLLFDFTFSIATLVLNVLFTIITWRWWHTLDIQGQAYLAANCRALAIYNIAMICVGLVLVPVVLLVLGCAVAMEPSDSC